MMLFEKPAWAVDARTGPVRNYLQLKFFAMEGLICIMDERPDCPESEQRVMVSPTDFETRLKSISLSYRNKGRMDLLPWQRREDDEKQKGYQNCVECIKEARAMGDPFSPEVQAFWSRHRRSSSVQLTFHPSADPAAMAAKLPPLPTGRFTGRTATPDIVAPRGVTIPSVYVPPTRKTKSGLIIPNQ